MDQTTTITKKAFIAHLNDLRNRVVVDTEFRMIAGSQKLVLIYEDGKQETFKGLRAA